MKETLTMSKSSTTTKRRPLNKARSATWNIHPGEILREEFLRPMGLTPYALAKSLRVSVPRINDIVLEKRAITADTALRLARFFGTTEQFWMNLQAGYELRLAHAEAGDDLANIRPIKAKVVA